jgi:bacterioferritin
VIEALQKRLDAEMLAIRHYMVHRAMAKQLGLDSLARHYAEDIDTEIRHGVSLIERILFLEGSPTADAQTAVPTSPDEMMRKDLEIELAAVNGYKEAAQVADEEHDQLSEQFLASLGLEEEGHLNDVEGQLDQIKLMGLALWMATEKRPAFGMAGVPESR